MYASIAAKIAPVAMQRGQSRADFMTAYQSATEQAGSMAGGFGEQLPAAVPSDLQGRKELESDGAASTSAGVNSNGMSTGECCRLTLSGRQNNSSASEDLRLTPTPVLLAVDCPSRAALASTACWSNRQWPKVHAGSNGGINGIGQAGTALTGLSSATLKRAGHQSGQRGQEGQRGGDPPGDHPARRLRPSVELDRHPRPGQPEGRRHTWDSRCQPTVGLFSVAERLPWLYTGSCAALLPSHPAT